MRMTWGEGLIPCPPDNTAQIARHELTPVEPVIFGRGNAMLYRDGLIREVTESPLL